MRLPGNKEIVIREREVIDEAELTEEEMEEKKMKEAKKGLIGTIALGVATFAGGIAAGVTGYKAYVSHKDNEDDGYIDVPTAGSEDQSDDYSSDSETDE